ncbi:hypothetical protein [Actinomycetospora cinnamomea]|uniref:NIPSNAP protein n=1 Tax=Actinomycetospora cinnamomea TaxID=663609 RepID=A0A2U1F105_9PSEU|nr:hypothetical protein [Actinomycetospora cinnamomea]PVZ05873.1 hypothetical protein C8D89_114129 [Actinomycetospora cinnamomea]
MGEQGKTNIVAMWTATTPEQVDEGDRIFRSHAKWMEGHSRSGDTALLSYRISKGPRLTNPLDPSSERTGDTIFVLSEIYETPAGVTEHWRLATETWEDFPAFLDWSRDCGISTLHSGTVEHALW